MYDLSARAKFPVHVPNHSIIDNAENICLGQLVNRKLKKKVSEFVFIVSFLFTLMDTKL